MKDLENYLNYLLQFYYNGNATKNPLKFEDMYDYINPLASKIYEILTISNKTY